MISKLLSAISPSRLKSLSRINMIVNTKSSTITDFTLGANLLVASPSQGQQATKPAECAVLPLFQNSMIPIMPNWGVLIWVWSGKSLTYIVEIVLEDFAHEHYSVPLNFNICSVTSRDKSSVPSKSNFFSYYFEHYVRAGNLVGKPSPLLLHSRFLIHDHLRGPSEPWVPPVHVFYLLLSQTGQFHLCFRHSFPSLIIIPHHPHKQYSRN